jgi:hypothetical protein
VADRRFNAKLILPDGTEKPSLIVYYPPSLTGEEVEAIGRQILAVFSGTLCSDVEDEEGRGTTTEDMLDAGLLDADSVTAPPAPDLRGKLAPLLNAFGELHWRSGRGHDVSHEQISEAFEAVLAADGVAPVEAPSCCEWREEDPYGEMSGTYASACGELWSFIDGGPTENNVRFCHGCGKPVDVAPPLPDPLAGVDDDAPRTDGVGEVPDAG